MFLRTDQIICVRPRIESRKSRILIGVKFLLLKAAWNFGDYAKRALLIMSRPRSSRVTIRRWQKEAKKGGGDYKIRGRGDLRLTSQQLRPMNDVRCVRVVRRNARYSFAPKRNRESDVTMMRNDITIVLCVLLLFVTTGETFQTKIQENKSKEKCV